MYLIDELKIKNSVFTSMGGLFNDNVHNVDIKELSAKLRDTNNEMNCIRGPFDNKEFFEGREPKWIMECISTIPDYYNEEGLFVHGGDPSQDIDNLDINWLMMVEPSRTVEYFLPTFPQGLGEIYPELYDGNVTFGDFNPYENAQSKLDYFFNAFSEFSHKGKLVFFRHNHRFYYRILNKNHYLGIPPNVIISTSFLYEK
jgi:hypothetical protein